MIVGKVIGTIVSTRKSEKLLGSKFMIVEPLGHRKALMDQASVRALLNITGHGKVIPLRLITSNRFHKWL